MAFAFFFFFSFESEGDRTRPKRTHENTPKSNAVAHADGDPVTITAVRVANKAMQDNVSLAADGSINYLCPATAKCATMRASSIYVTVRDAVGGCSRSGLVAITGLTQPAKVEVSFALVITTPDGKCPNATAAVRRE